MKKHKHILKKISYYKNTYKNTNDIFFHIIKDSNELIFSVINQYTQGWCKADLDDLLQTLYISIWKQIEKIENEDLELFAIIKTLTKSRTIDFLKKLYYYEKSYRKNIILADNIKKFENSVIDNLKPYQNLVEKDLEINLEIFLKKVEQDKDIPKSQKKPKIDDIDFIKNYIKYRVEDLHYYDNLMQHYNINKKQLDNRILRMKEKYLNIFKKHINLLTL